MANTLKFGDGKWATGEGTALAFNDENDNFKPLPFTFTRASKATVVNQSGLIEEVGNDVPRIDFKDNTKGALLLEPARTNLVTYSEDFSQFSGGGSIVIESGYLAPDGTNSAYKVSGSGGALNFGFGLTNSETRSIYAKTISGQGNANLCSYFGNTNNLKTITEDWQRFEVNGTTTEAGVTNFYAVDFRGSTDLNEIIIWGAQAEQGSYATSYIKTEGSAVTRVADSCNQTVPDGIIGQTEGTIFFEIDNKGHDRTSANTRFNLNLNTSTNEWIFLGFEVDYKIRIYIRSGSVTSVDSRSPAQSIGVIKAAARFNTDGDWALYVNGTKTNSGSNAVVSQLLNRINIGSPPLIKELIRGLRVYNTALTDQELASLTQE